MSEIVRKLASIQKIAAIEPIPGADRIEVAQVLGWKVVVQKGLYQPGELVAWFEIDSFLPVKPEYEFLRKSSYRVTRDLGEGFRIKTVKLRGQISQGLILPLSELDCPIYVDHSYAEFLREGVVEGADLTEVLGVRKWEPNAQVILSGNVEGAFPWFVPKTDEPRVQNLSRERQEWAGEEFVVTVKYDGSSMTVFSKDDVVEGREFHVGVCSRNWELKDEGENTYWKVAHDTGLIRILNAIRFSIAIQGELVGPGIQGNPYNYDKHHFIIFNIWDIVNQKYFTNTQRHDFIKAINVLFKTDLQVCHTLHYGVYGVLDQSMLDQVLSDIGRVNDQEIEGIVFKGVEHPERSYKYINPDYLLKDKG